MPAYPNTGSTLYSNRTGVSLSTQVIIYADGIPVGAVTKLSVTESRGIQMIHEVGTDGNIDSAPNSPVKISGNCTRTRFDRMRIAEAFRRGFIHVQSQRVPFDIQIFDRWNGDGNNQIITTIHNVWINNISYDYGSDNYIMVDTMGWEAETIFSTLANGNAATGGERGVPIFIDPYEREADRGGRRGALDAPGLLVASFG